MKPAYAFTCFAGRICDWKGVIDFVTISIYGGAVFAGTLGSVKIHYKGGSGRHQSTAATTIFATHGPESENK